MLTDFIDKEKEAKKYMTEFLTLPCTAIGQTTSSSIAEKSNIWAEQRLSKQKCELDKKLYKSMVKLNVDMLGLTDELNKMRKSASSSSLDNFHVKHKHGNTGCASGQNSPNVHVRNKTATAGVGTNKSFGRSHNKNGLSTNRMPNGSTSGEYKTLSDSSDGQNKPVNFSLGVESSSDESEHSDNNTVSNGKTKAHLKPSHHLSNGRHRNDLHRTISVTSCSTGHECGAQRANIQSFKNATKRYNKQLSDHSKSALHKK